MRSAKREPAAAVDDGWSNFAAFVHLQCVKTVMKGSMLVLSLSLALGVSAASSSQAAPTTPKLHIYLANDDHTDYMWTTDADKYNATFVDMLDYYLNLADSTVNNPSPYQSRFNADGSYWLWQYERRKSPAEFSRLMARVKDGHISAPLNTLVSCYGAQPLEAVLRGMYYAGRLERRYNLRFPIAVAMENQTLPLGLSSVWAGSGALYSWKGVCDCATKLKKEELGHRDHEIYWYTGLDGQRVLMKWYSAAPGYIGTYLEAENPEYSIHFLESNPDFLRRYTNPKTGVPYSVRGAFGFGGDCLDRKTGVPAVPKTPKEPGVAQQVIGYPYTEHFHVTAKRESNDSRRVFVSNMTDFFEDFNGKYGPDLPSESVTYGNEWDLYSASMAETSARVRRSVEKLRSAELMSTLVSLKAPAFLKGRETARDEAFTALGLYWEHDWTADGPISRTRRAAWQDKLAGEIEYYVNPLHADASERLGYLIARPETANRRFFVLNALGAPRTDFADFLYSGSADIHVRDVATGIDVPHQLMTVAGRRYLRILAPDVPSAGYKTFDILSGVGSATATPAATTAANSGGAWILENSAVRLAVEPSGAIGSLIDKRRGNAELAATIAGAKLNDLSPGIDSGSITVENSGPVSVTLRCDSSAGLAHTTWITLYKDSNRIDICNRIMANFGDNRYWSFGFNLSSPDVHTEEIGAILHDRLKSQGGHYADTHARYDHVTLNHFADITDGAGKSGVTLSNADCSFARIGDSTATTLDTTTPQINVLAGGQIDGRYLGIQNQNGATEFLQRFALQPHGAYSPASAMRFALEHQNPMVTGGVAGAVDAPYPAAAYSLLSISDPDVMLWAVKPAEEGIDKGVIVRLWNVGAKPRGIKATLTPGLVRASRVTHIETDLAPLTVSGGAVELKMKPTQIQTVRLTPPPPPPAGQAK